MTFLGVARQAARSFSALNRAAHTTSKRRLRAELLTELRAAIEALHGELKGLLDAPGAGERANP